MDLTDAEIEQANARSADRQRMNARAASARYDRGRGRIVLRLDNGLEIMFAPDDAQGLTGARTEQLPQIKLSGGGVGLHFPMLDADFDVPTLLEGRMGSDEWMQALARKRAAA